MDHENTAISPLIEKILKKWLQAASQFLHMDVWESEFFVTWGVILKSVLFEFFFSFMDKYVSKALGFFISFTKSFFFSRIFSNICILGW